MHPDEIACFKCLPRTVDRQSARADLLFNIAHAHQWRVAENACGLDGPIDRPNGLRRFRCLYLGGHHRYAASCSARLPCRNRTSQSAAYPTRLVKSSFRFQPVAQPVYGPGRRTALCELWPERSGENLPGAGGTMDRRPSHAPIRTATRFSSGEPTRTPSAPLSTKVDLRPRWDFAPVAAVAVNSSALVVTPPVPAKTVQELIKFLKSKPGGLAGGAPIGVAPHVMVAYFMANRAPIWSLCPIKAALR